MRGRRPESKHTSLGLTLLRVRRIVGAAPLLLKHFESAKPKGLGHLSELKRTEGLSMSLGELLDR